MAKQRLQEVELLRGVAMLGVCLLYTSFERFLITGVLLLLH